MTIQFANPVFLLLTLLAPLLMWRLLVGKRTALRYPVGRFLSTLPVGRARVAHWGGALLRTLAFVLLAIALAGPRTPDLHTRIDAEGVAIVMLVDVSGSMATRDFDWHGDSISRLDAVKRVFRLFIAGGAGSDATLDGGDARSFQGRPTDAIGLVVFATRPRTACPLTLSHSVLLRLLDDEKPRSVPGESETNISDAVTLGLRRLQSAGSRHKVLVLLTDGEHNVPNPRSDWAPRQAAQIAASLGVPIYTIDAGGGVGSAEPDADSVEGGGDSSPLVRQRAVETLEDVAKITHGQYYRAGDTAGLLDACQALDRLERTDVESYQYRRYHEGYPWFAGTALLLFTAALGLDFTLWRRLP
jgi:Ca-activated chloride channel family protein